MQGSPTSLLPRITIFRRHEFKAISPAVKLANIFVKFKKRDGVKIYAIKFLEFAAFDDK